MIYMKWKSRSTAGEIVNNRLYPPIGKCVGYLFVQTVLTDTPQYYPNYQVLRKFFNHYLIIATENHTVETWEKIYFNIKKLSKINQNENQTN